MSSEQNDGPYETEEDLLDPGTAPPPETESQDDGQDPEPDTDDDAEEEDSR